MEITEILRGISVSKIKSYESLTKQPIQPIIKLNSPLRHIMVTHNTSSIQLSYSSDVFTNLFIYFYLLLKFAFSKKATKIDEIIINFCGLLRKHEL